MKAVAVMIAATVASLTTQCFAADPGVIRWWPQFRGPGALGIAEPGAYPVKFDAGANVLWRTPLPSGISSPCIWENHIFLTAHDKPRNVLETICVDRKAGRILWRKDVSAPQIERVHQVSSPANATPASDGERVYVYFASYGLMAYDFTGAVAWTAPLPLMSSNFGSGTSPIVADGFVLLNRDGQVFRGANAGNAPKTQLLAFDAKTGKVVWEVDRRSSFSRYATPVIWRHDEKSQVLLLGKV